MQNTVRRPGAGDSPVASVIRPDVGPDRISRKRGRPPKHASAAEAEGTAATGYRVQIRMTTRGYERLARIQKMTEASTAADVVRDAMRVYEAIVEAINAGKHVTIEDPKNPNLRERLNVL